MSATVSRRPLSRAQKVVLTAAFVPMVATGVAGGAGTFSNISAAYGRGTALGAVAAGEGATAVLALVLLGLTMLGQSSPHTIRLGLWALPAAASVMAATAGTDAGHTVIYAVTPMGMCASAEGAAFLARRIVVHTSGHDAEAERRSAAVVRSLAYHRARAANHPSKGARKRSDRTSWRLARQVGTGDATLGSRLLDVQRQRVTTGADAALAAMFTPAALDPTPIENAEESAGSSRERSTPDLPVSSEPTIVLTRLAVPDPAPVDLGKSGASVKPMRAVAPAVKPVPIAPAARSVPAESARPNRATGRVPDAAKSARPRRTFEQLMTEARKATAGLTDQEVTGEGIRRALRTSPANARKLRDALLAERAAGAVAP
ncbi:conjugal transfer protein [Streptomyces sp. RPA4-2]|uniref:conjugal transfer protein n=1 Tax=Streptomyces sp. RPA4-2 TaxID=2721244 RepID=UPI00143EB0C6|nr:conjugal transfer protein [Streptomyces sp. RPA4-2]QIY63470.1 conjugal transfer protein [Streptomyces sp. RPA4-2]